MATEIISLYIYYNGQLLQRQHDRVSDFIIYFNIFGEVDNVEDCDAAQLINFCGRVDNACELVHSAGTCKENTHFNSINIIVLILI